MTYIHICDTMCNEYYLFSGWFNINLTNNICICILAKKNICYTLQMRQTDTQTPKNHNL